MDMTFRELLSLYQKGELPKEQQEYVESEIEKHEAISEYLYDDSELPVLENAAPSEKNEKDTKQSEDFTRLIRKMIRRAFIKMGVTVGAVVLAAVMAVTCFFPDIVASFYYDPEKTVGYPSYATKTTQMALDLSVFTELFLPSTYRNDVIIDDEGYGNYHISIPETLSYDGKNTTVSGKLEKGKLTLYDPNLLAYPASNAFVLPKGAEGYYSMGAAGTAEEAFARLQKLDEYDYYTAYFSLSELMDYESFYEEFGLQAQWCAVHLGKTTQAVLGMSTGISGSLMDWDREAYPRLCLLDSKSELSELIEMPKDAQIMQTHFLSMLSYMKDHPEAMALFGAGELPWGDIMRYVNEKGLSVYGFAVTARRDTILELAQTDMISYVYTKPFR